MSVLAASKSLARVAAARANLTGDMPNLGSMHNVEVDHARYSNYSSPIVSSLQVLDLSQNNMSGVAGLNAKSFVSLSGNGRVRIRHGLLQEALQQGTRLDLTDVDLADMSEPIELLAKGLLNSTDVLTFTDAKAGFSCYGIDSAWLQVTPSRFLPRLLCGCQPGRYGRSTHCEVCGNGTYNALFNQSQCVQCPLGSFTEYSGAVSQETCQCQVGRTPRGWNQVWTDTGDQQQKCS